jgi:hypothetical protein
MTAPAPEIAPLGVWDTRDRYWGLGSQGKLQQAVTWSTRHVPRARDTYRIEFYLLDVPFAVLHRYAVNAGGHKFTDPATNEPSTEEPVRLTLGELPPEHLARREPALRSLPHELADWSWLADFGQPQPGDIALIDHQVRFDPARVLREVQAKRAILREHTPHTRGRHTVCSSCSYGNSLGATWPCLTVEKTAAVYSDHPDYADATGAQP